ncbi:MAG TPA: Gfo/Idh/MocA family oxidoreductase [Chthonomonadales bacterium]|nr:Gfo/Idh/MocA family oxidoreductase [Chthonomonadales bacterium]
MNQNDDTRRSSRREFLRDAAVTAAATVAVASVAKSSVYALAPPRVIGANDRIRAGHVGVGGQGLAHIRMLQENAAAFNVENIAVCDIYNRRTRLARELLNLPEARGFDDYRRLLEVREIDAVWISTADNWHEPITTAAMEAGKHVYVEKPLCRTIEETFRIYDTCKRTQRVLQVGSQGCSDPKWHVARKAVADGKIGHAIMGQGSFCRNSREGEWNYYAIDEGAGPSATGDNFINWDVFRRGTEPAQWCPDRFFRWRKYWAYGTGIVGDLFPHRLHPLVIAMNLPTTGEGGWPSRVASLGGIFVQRTSPVTNGPDREVPDFTNLVADFHENCSIMLLGSTINEQGWQDMIRGTKGTLFFGGAGVDVRPERVWADEIEGGNLPVEGEGERLDVHQKDFVDCIRTGRTPTAGIDLAARVQVMVSMAETAYRMTRTVTFDPRTRQMTA